MVFCLPGTATHANRESFESFIHRHHNPRRGSHLVQAQRVKRFGSLRRTTKTTQRWRFLKSLNRMGCNRGWQINMCINGSIPGIGLHADLFNRQSCPLGIVFCGGQWTGYHRRLNKRCHNNEAVRNSAAPEPANQKTACCRTPLSMEI